MILCSALRILELYTIVKIAYVGDFLNHGKSLQTTGTPIVILLSLLENVDSIDVFCPKVNKDTEQFELPPKVTLQEFYTYDNSRSILGLLGIKWKNYDVVILNMLPTGFGNKTLVNATALSIPILLVKFLRQKNIKVIYHNSVFTNDFKKLGYKSALDKIRSFFLGIVEKILFRNIDTFVLLDLYRERITKSIGENRTRVLNSRYLEAITTMCINKMMNLEYLKVERSDTTTILMHGSWGPQKNIELGLSALKEQKEKGAKFRLVISGGSNHHFPEYEGKFQKMLHSYSDIIDEYLGTVTEKDIMKIFLKASLLLLPYNTPGGHSGVLEQAIFFEVPTIAIDFPEYREQAKRTTNVYFANQDNFSSELKKHLNSLADEKKISIRDKIMEVKINIKQLIESSNGGE